jgi:hypothetical protein
MLSKVDVMMAQGTKQTRKVQHASPFTQMGYEIGK